MLRDMELTTEWELGNFTEEVDLEGATLLVDEGSKRALLIMPWYTEPPMVALHLIAAKDRGFTSMVEFGNLLGYQVKDSDTDDSDYILLEA